MRRPFGIGKKSSKIFNEALRIAIKDNKTKEGQQ